MNAILTASERQHLVRLMGQPQDDATLTQIAVLYRKLHPGSVRRLSVALIDADIARASVDDLRRAGL